MALLHKDTY